MFLSFSYEASGLWIKYATVNDHQEFEPLICVKFLISELLMTEGNLIGQFILITFPEREMRPELMAALANGFC